jgi:hypothetical protein
LQVKTFAESGERCMQQLLPCEREDEETLFNQPVKAIRIKQAAFLQTPAFQAG